jgi:RHS repeat-associated protein
MTIIFTAMITTGGNKGLYYYGARYYDPKVSVWLSVDPLASDAPHLTSYRFSFNNPLVFIDKDGLFEGWYRDENNKLLYDENINSQEDMKDNNVKGTFVGLTHEENGSYYSLLGEKLDASSFDGKVAQKIDQALINYGEYLSVVREQSEKDKTAGWTSDFEMSGAELEYVDLDGLLNYSEDFTGANRRKNMATSQYYCATVYIQVYKYKESNKGKVIFGRNNFNNNKGYGLGPKMNSGFNMYVKNSKGGTAMTIVFPDLAAKQEVVRKFNIIYK